MFLFSYTRFVGLVDFSAVTSVAIKRLFSTHNLENDDEFLSFCLILNRLDSNRSKYSGISH